MRDSLAVDSSCARDFAVFERWTLPAREILQFPSGGTLPRVRFGDSRAVERYRAWDSAIPERWTLPARGILQFPSDRLFPHVGFPDSRALDGCQIGRAHV